MRLLLVSPYDLSVPGGVQAHVRQLAAALRRAGDSVTTLSPGPSADGHVGVGGTVRLPFNDSVAPIGLDPRVAGRVRAAVREAAPDVVHVHEPAVPWVGPASVLSAPVPVVGTVHAWSERDRAYRAARPVLRPLVERLADLIAVSPAAARYHATALGLDERALTVVPNGVDVAPFAEAEPLPEVVDRGRPHLLFLGRLERRKGLEHLVRAFVSLRATRPELRLVVAGEGPERARCEALLPARIRSDVEFLGYVAEDHKRRLLRSCDVFVAPAVGGESFGIVLLEAMAAGCPVIASDIPGYRTVVTDRVDGRLVAPGDPRGLAAEVAALLDGPALRTAMADEGRRTAARHDWHEVAGRLRHLYETARNGSRPV